MDWITGLQKAIDYIEEHITEELDYEAIAHQSFSSSYHFQRIFSILCGYTLGEYIRSRRLSLAASELIATDKKVIDIALKYGYENPDSFTKAFSKFHGVTPSQAKDNSTNIKSFSRLSIKISLEGGNVMNYRIEEKPSLTFTGITSHFSGSPSGRYQQQHDFMVKGETRFVRYALQGMAHDCSVEYAVISDITDSEYNFTIGTIIPQYFNNHLEKTVGKTNTEILNVINVPASKYLVVETEKTALSIQEHLNLRAKAVSEWFCNSEYRLSNSPEITVFHTDHNNTNNSYIELWLPIEYNG